jgi:hypothetical protein
MISPRVSLLALLIGLAGCYKRGKRQCNWAFLILLRTLCNSGSVWWPDALWGAQHPHHDRVAHAIETVISRYDLGMLLPNSRGIS